MPTHKQHLQLDRLALGYARSVHKYSQELEQKAAPLLARLREIEQERAKVNADLVETVLEDLDMPRPEGLRSWHLQGDVMVLVCEGEAPKREEPVAPGIAERIEAVEELVADIEAGVEAIDEASKLLDKHEEPATVEAA